jgi:Fas-binding factor 1
MVEPSPRGGGMQSVLQSPAAGSAGFAGEGQGEIGSSVMQSLQALHRQHGSVTAQIERQHHAELSAAASEHKALLDTERVSGIEAVQEEQRKLQRLEMGLEKAKAEAAARTKEAADITVDRVAEVQVERERAAAREQLLQDLHARQIEALERQQHEAMSATRRVHEGEIGAVRAEVEGRRVLEEITAEVRSTAGSLKSLQKQVAVIQSRGEARRRAEREVSRRLWGELEQRSRGQQHRAEEECDRLQNLLQGVDSSVRLMREQGLEERERLKGEQGRLDLLQATLKAEADATRKGLEHQRQELVEERLVFDKERREAESRIVRRREALAAERRTLAEERTLFLEMQQQRTQELKGAEDQARATVEAARHEKAALEREIARHRSTVQSTAAELTALQQELRPAELKRSQLQTTAEQLGALGEMLQERERKLQMRHDEIAQQVTQSSTSKQEASEAMGEAMKLRASLADTQRRQQAEQQQLVRAHQQLNVARAQMVDAVKSERAASTPSNHHHHHHQPHHQPQHEPQPQPQHPHPHPYPHQHQPQPQPQPARTSTPLQTGAWARTRAVLADEQANFDAARVQKKHHAQQSGFLLSTLTDSQ